MFKIVFVLFTLVLAIDSSILNRLRRLGGDSQDSLDDFIVMDPTKDIVSGNNGIEYCVGTKPLTTLPPFRKFLGLNRDLDSPVRSKFRISTCKTRWIFHGIGDETVTTHNFTLKTTYKKGDLFLSTLPDRLSPVNEQPEKFTLKDVKRSSAKNIISHYAGHEFNGFSLLCHTNGKLIYYKNIKTNRDNNDCQWEFLKLKPIPTPTRLPTHSPTTTITPVPTDSPITSAPTGSPTTTITSTPTELPTHSPITPVPTDSPITSAPTGSPTTTITPVPTDSPITSAPTELPTHSPITSTPTELPTHSPITSAPTELPTTLAAPTTTTLAAPTTTTTTAALPTTTEAAPPTSYIYSTEAASPTSYIYTTKEATTRGALPRFLAHKIEKNDIDETYSDSLMNEHSLVVYLSKKTWETLWGIVSIFLLCNIAICCVYYKD